MADKHRSCRSVQQADTLQRFVEGLGTLPHSVAWAGIHQESGAHRSHLASARTLDLAWLEELGPHSHRSPFQLDWDRPWETAGGEDIQTWDWQMADRLEESSSEVQCIEGSRKLETEHRLESAVGEGNRRRIDQ